MAEHVPGTQLRYKHGWIPIGEVEKVLPETTKYGLATGFEHKAQKHAEYRFAAALREAGGAHGYYGEQPELTHELDPGTPEHAWGMYQAQPYVEINNYLRTGENNPSGWFDAKEEAAGIVKAFDTMGVDTPAPLRFYRGLSNKGTHDWDAEIKVGQTYQDKGVVSTSAEPKEVLDFLADNNQDPDFSSDAMLEIHVPEGTRMLGGTIIGTETMLAPGTKFRVLRKTKTRTKSGAMTKFIVEVVK